MTSKIRKGISIPLIKNSLKMSGSNMIMYMLPVVVTPILSRLYSPQDFGEWGVFSSFVTIVGIALFAGFDNAIMKAERDEVVPMLKVCMTAAVINILVIALCFQIGASLNIAFFSGFPDIPLLFSYLIIHIAYTLGYNLCNRSEKYTALSVNNIVQGGSQAIFRIAFALCGITIFNGLILGNTTALLLSTAFFAFSLRRVSFKESMPVRWSGIKAIIKKYRKFPLYDAPSSLLSFAAFNLPVIILSIYFNKAEIGCLSIIFQLLLMPMSLIGTAIGKVYYQELCKEDNNNFTKATTQRIIRILAIISIVPLLFIVCGGDYIIVMFLGSKWHTAGVVAICLSLWSFPTILTQPLLPIFRYQSKQNIMLRYDLLYFIGGIGSIIAGCELTGDLYTILIVYSITCFLCKALLFVKIAKVSNVGLAICKRFIPLWSLSIAILIIRLLHIS